MNAAKFIAEKGWDQAKHQVEFLTRHLATDQKFTVINNMVQRSTKGFTVGELKIYVDAWELVNQFDDIEQAKAYLPEIDNDVPWSIKGSELRFFKWQLEEAITLVEEVESLKEVG